MLIPTSLYSLAAHTYCSVDAHYVCSFSLKQMDGLVEEASHLCTAMVETAVIAAQRDIRRAGTASTTAATAAVDAIMSLLALATTDAAAQTAGATTTSATDIGSLEQQQVSTKLLSRNLYTLFVRRSRCVWLKLSVIRYTL
jgi:hypothetical protein